MKKNPSTIGFIVSVLMFIVAFGIYFLFLAKKNEYLVDNPTNNTYYFKINNGEEMTIASGQFIKVDLHKGQNKIQVFDDNKKLLYDSTFQVDKIRGLLNISHSDYYINKQYYGYGVDIKKDSLLSALGQIEIDGKKYYGGAKHFNRLYTEDFYYNVDENYDKIIKNIDKVETRVKIFRKEDYLNYYKEYYNF